MLIYLAGRVGLGRGCSLSTNNRQA